MRLSLVVKSKLAILKDNVVLVAAKATAPLDLSSLGMYLNPSP